MSTPVTNNRIFRLGDLPRSVAGRVVKLPREMADSLLAERLQAAVGVVGDVLHGRIRQHVQLCVLVGAGPVHCRVHRHRGHDQVLIH